MDSPSGRMSLAGRASGLSYRLSLQMSLLGPSPHVSSSRRLGRWGIPDRDGGTQRRAFFKFPVERKLGRPRVRVENIFQHSLRIRFQGLSAFVCVSIRMKPVSTGRPFSAPRRWRQTKTVPDMDLQRGCPTYPSLQPFKSPAFFGVGAEDGGSVNSTIPRQLSEIFCPPLA